MSVSPVLCLGEALIDVVTRGENQSEHVGGSPLNVASGLAALGVPVELAAWWGHDDHGRMIEEYAAAHNVGVVPGSDGASRTSVAKALLNADGHATYTFDLEWDLPQLPAEVRHVHTGSIAATLNPGAAKVAAAVREAATRTTVSYDPNARPDIMKDPDAVRPGIEAIISQCDVVKASDEDIAWLYGDEDPRAVMRTWIARGATMVVVTRGWKGAYVRLVGERDVLTIDPLTATVVDTVGAGDSFMAGLLSGLLDAGLLGSYEAKARLRSAKWADILTAVHRGTITAGITVQHEGAYAPGPSEVITQIDREPGLR